MGCGGARRGAIGYDGVKTTPTTPHDMRIRISPRSRRNILRIIPFGVIWVLMAQLFLISDFAAVGGFENVPDFAIVVDPGIYLFATLAVGVVGLLVGAFELLVLNRHFSKRSLATKLIGKTLFYLVFLTMIVLVTFPIAAAMEMDVSVFDPSVTARLRDFAWSPAALGTSVQLSAQLVASLFYAEISEHMGPHVLRDFLSGRYHTPKDERRIFLFSDMKDSTRIAEVLGHSRYFEFVREYYDALADALVDHGGQVYQYVGDEIVVSWPEEGGLDDARCIRCVLRMQADLRSCAGDFRARFGEAPEFRAGLQVGPVTTGEIGALKREIVFTGDVLNQTARLQSLAKEVDFDVVVGGELAGLLALPEEVGLVDLGHHVLRGRRETVELFGLEVHSVSR